MVLLLPLAVGVLALGLVIKFIASAVRVSWEAALTLVGILVI